VDGDRGPLRWSLLLIHLWHHLQCHLRLPLELHDILKDSFEGPGLTDRSWPQSHPDNRIYSSHARHGGHAGGRGPGQKR
jgi:hypothetical protein